MTIFNNYPVYLTVLCLGSEGTSEGVSIDTFPSHPSGQVFLALTSLASHLRMKADIWVVKFLNLPNLTVHASAIGMHYKATPKMAWTVSNKDKKKAN